MKEKVMIVAYGNDQDYRDAYANIKAGRGSDRDYELAEQMAKQAGSEGNKARDALNSVGRFKR